MDILRINNNKNKNKKFSYMNINNRKIRGKTIIFNSSFDSILNAIRLNSSNLTENSIDKYFINIVDTQKNNGVYIILPYKINN